MKISRKFQIRLGLAIMTVSLIGFFWYGIAFEVFGSKIRANWQNVGFFAWLALGMFGLGFTFGGVRMGFKTLGTLVLLFAAALVIGILRGNYG